MSFKAGVHGCGESYFGKINPFHILYEHLAQLTLLKKKKVFTIKKYAFKLMRYTYILKCIKIQN